MAKNKKWIVTASGDQPLSEVKKKITEKGFKVEQVFDQINCISGSANDDIAEEVKHIPGVEDVSLETDINIGPPDESVNW